MGLLDNLSSALTGSRTKMIYHVKSREELLNLMKMAITDNRLTNEERSALVMAASEIRISEAEVNSLLNDLAVRNCIEEIQRMSQDGELGIAERTAITMHARGLGLKDDQIDELFNRYAPNETSFGLFSQGKKLSKTVAQGVANMVSSMHGDHEVKGEQISTAQQSGYDSTYPSTPMSVGTQQYKVIVNGTQHGPYTLQQMQQFIAQGRMNRNTRVLVRGRQGEFAAGQIPELLQLLSQYGY